MADSYTWSSQAALARTYFGQPPETRRPTANPYPSITAAPLPGADLLASHIDRRAVDRFLRTHYTRLKDWDLLQYVNLDANTIDVELLSDEDLAVLEGALKVEANNPVYVRKLLEHFKTDLYASNFIVLWGYEEFKHYYAAQSYLAKVWAIRYLRSTSGTTGPFPADVLNPVVDRAYAVLDEKTERVRQNGETVWEIPAQSTGLQVISFAALQELLTHVFYKLSARRVREPVLRGLLTKLAGDEQAHHVVYNQSVDRALSRDPERREEVVRVFRDFEMPHTALLQDGHAQLAEMATYAGRGDVAESRKQMRRVLKFLVGKIGEDATVEVLATEQPAHNRAAAPVKGSQSEHGQVRPAAALQAFLRLPASPERAIRTIRWLLQESMPSPSASPA